MQEDLLYTSVCSAVTLQSEKKGFFMAMAQKVTENVGQKWLQKFSKVKTDEERIQLCYQNCEIRSIFIEPLTQIPELYRGKSSKVSQEKRLEGDKVLASGDMEKALMLYSQSVVRAPAQGQNTDVDNGLSLALALAARAQVLLKLKEFNSCINDIQMAIKQGYPQHLRYRLYWYMGCAYKNLSEIGKAQVSLQLSLQMLDVLYLEAGEDAEQIKKNIQSELASVNGSLGQNHKVKEASHEQKSKSLPEVTGKCNQTLENASSLLSVKETTEAGRFIVAKERIHAGDTLVVESPYAACLLPDMFASHCHHCFTRLRAPVACSDCCSVAFCSEECRSEACSTYHRYECHCMDLFLGSGMSVLCHLALRMVTQSGIQFFLTMKDHPRTELVKKYEKVCGLVTHADKRTTTDFLHRTLMSVFLLICLQKTDFYLCENNEADLSKEKLLIGSILLRHLQILQFNAHEIYETKLSTAGKYRSSSMNYTAVGIYPSVALFNHECYPGVSRYFNGKTIVITAIRPHQPSDIVAENYGPVFTKHPLAERQRTLSSRYWFWCSCKACVENWPVLKDISNDFKIRCTTSSCQALIQVPPDVKNVKCTSCQKELDLSELTECNNKYKDGVKAVDDNNILEAINLLSSYLDSIHCLCVPPHKNISHCQDLLRVCLASNGNLCISKT